MFAFCGPTAEGLPDAGYGACCIGSAMRGPEYCTCWKPVYDRRAQRRPRLELQPTPRDECCVDCAYRPDSPEHRGEAGYAANERGELEALVDRGETFWCHQGIRHALTLRHTSGTEVPAHPGRYDPPIVAGVPYQANGRPANICAGWWARRQKLLEGMS